MPEGNDTSTTSGRSEEDLRREAERAVEDGRTIERLTRLMQERNELEQEVERLQSATPADDETTISESDADTLRELDLLTEDGEIDPSGLREQLEQGRDAQQEVKQLRRQQRRRKVYDATDLNRKAADDILPEDVEFRTEEGDAGMAVQVVDAEGETHDLSDYLEDNFSEPVRDALTSGGSETNAGEEGESSTSGSSSESSTSGSSSGSPSQSYPEQTPASTSQPDDSDSGLSDEEIRQRKLANQNYSA